MARIDFIRKNLSKTKLGFMGEGYDQLNRCRKAKAGCLCPRAGKDRSRKRQEEDSRQGHQAGAEIIGQLSFDSSQFPFLDIQSTALRK